MVINSFRCNILRNRLLSIPPLANNISSADIGVGNATKPKSNIVTLPHGGRHLLLRSYLRDFGVTGTAVLPDDCNMVANTKAACAYLSFCRSAWPRQQPFCLLAVLGHMSNETIFKWCFE